MQSNSASGPFIISRTFDVPSYRVWRAWTDRDRLMHWFGPKGFKMTHARVDFRPGGSFHYCLQGPDGKAMWGKFVYRESVPLQRMVLLNSFSDPGGGTTVHPINPTWPREMLSTTTLTEENGKTTVTVCWEPFNATAEERMTFDSNHETMKMGWGGTFDQLADYLSKR